MEDMIMKKIITVSILAAAAAIMISCDKSELQQSLPSSSRSFVGSIDNVTTKTVLTEADKLNWEAGDEISINGVTFSAVPDAENPAKAVFENQGSADPQLESGKYNAYYPASLLVDGVPTLPLVQTYSENSLAGVNPMFAQSEDNTLSFKNICGLIEISLTGSKTIAAIEVSSDNLGMSGAFTINDNFDAVVDGTDGVLLDCGDGVKLSTRNATKFYIAVPAGTYENLSIFVYTTDNYIGFINAEQAVVKRNVIYAVAPSIEFISLDYLAFVGNYAYPAIDYFDDYADAVGEMQVYPYEYNKSFALFFPGATPEYEGETYDYFIASYDSRTKTMSLPNFVQSEEGAVWSFQGIKGDCMMSMDFGYWFDEKTVPESLDFVSDKDYNLTVSCSSPSLEEDDYIYLEATILDSKGGETGYATAILIVADDTFYNLDNLEMSEKPQLARKAAVKPVANKDFTLRKTKEPVKGTGAYLMK